MQIINNPKQNDWKGILQRPTQTVDAIEKTVNLIFDDVKRNGDQAISKYTSMFDGTSLDTLVVSDDEINQASSRVSSQLKEAIQLAKTNITTFHTAQKTKKVEVETMEGVTCWQEKRPIDTIGFYIPGGTAPLFSTVLMLGVPAQIAGCNDIILCTPPNKDCLLYTSPSPRD